MSWPTLRGRLDNLRFRRLRGELAFAVPLASYAIIFAIQLTEHQSFSASKFGIQESRRSYFLRTEIGIFEITLMDSESQNNLRFVGSKYPRAAYNWQV
jgi:hypothetical protein